MSSLAAIIAGLSVSDGVWHGQLPETWLQGRTAYGGLTTALALHVAQQAEPELPPLRTAQVAFIGPLAGNIKLRAERLRRGRNAAFVQVDIEGEAGLGLRATFVFLRESESAIDHPAPRPLPGFPRPTPETRVYDGPSGLAFIKNFAFVDRRDDIVGPAEWVRWVRLKKRDGLDPLIEVAAIGDCLPPAALKLLGAAAPLSTMTWQLNLLTPAPATQDGWWLLRAVADQAGGGASSQTMAIWNAAGEPIATGIQSVVVFG